MRTRTATATVILLLALTGCASGDPVPSQTATVATSPTPTVNPEKQFLTAVHTADFDSWKTKGPTDEELIAYPPQWCTELEAGHSVDYILSLQGANLYPIGSDWGTAKADAQELVVLGVTAYCPDFRDQVADELRDSGGF